MSRARFRGDEGWVRDNDSQQEDEARLLATGNRRGGRPRIYVLYTGINPVNVCSFTNFKVCTPSTLLLAL